MTYTDIAAKLSVSVPTVTLRARRELWVKGDAVDLERLNYTPMQMVETAVRALMRAANQTHDLASSVKAAGMLLDRVMGRVMAEQTTPMLTTDEPPALTMDEEAWLNRFARAAQARPEPEPPQDTAQATPEPPAASEPPARAISAESADSKSAAAADLPRLHVVQAEPSFWDGPGRPASGPTRDPRLN